MEFKKCIRCGCFFLSEDNVCCNCKSKDLSDVIKIQNYLEEHSSPSSIEELSLGTGISIKNLNRFGQVQNINGFFSYGFDSDIK